MNDEETKEDMDDDSKYNDLREQIVKLKEAIALKLSSNAQINVLSTIATQKKESLYTLTPSPSFRVRRKLEGHFGKIYALNWSNGDAANNEFADIVSASQDGKLLIWNVSTTNKKLAINLKSSWVMTCKYSLNNKFVASGGLDSICSIYDISNIPDGGWHSDKPYRELIKHEGYTSDIQFIDNETILTSSGDGTCILWDIIKNKAISTYIGHDGDIECIDVNREKSIFVSGGIDYTAKIWDLRGNTQSNNSCIYTFKGHESDINCIKFFNDNNSFISGSDDNSIKLFDLKSYQQLNEYGNNTIKSPVISCDFSKSGYYIIAGYEDQEPFCMTWNTLNNQIEKELIHNLKVSCIQTSPNGYCIATGSWDKLLRIWA